MKINQEEERDRADGKKTIFTSLKWEKPVAT